MSAPRPLTRPPGAPGRARAGLLLAVAVATAGLGACSPPADPPPPVPSGSSSSSSSSNSPATPTDADTVAAATGSLARFLADNGFGHVIKGANTVSYTIEKDTYVAKVHCAGGVRHEVGWAGICGATSKGLDPFVIPTRVVEGPKAESYAMTSDDAAYCGDDQTPKWVKSTLKAASTEYCYLKPGEG